MRRQNELLKKKINKLSYNQKFEIYNILVKSNQKFSENKNGIFFNLKYLNQSTIESIQAFLNYSDKIQETVYHNEIDTEINRGKEDSLHTQYDNYNENNDKKADTEEFTLYNNNGYTTVSPRHSNNNEEDEDNQDENIIEEHNEDNEDNEEGETEVNEIYNLEKHEHQEEQDIENVPIEYEIEEEIDINDFSEKESTKNKFIFKNYMNKLHLQSKEMNVKLYKQTNQKCSTTKINSSLQYISPTINSKLTGSKSRIYNVCRNIHKSNEYC